MGEYAFLTGIAVFLTSCWGYTFLGINLGMAIVAALVTTFILLFVLSQIVDKDWFDRRAQQRRDRPKETRFSIIKRKRVPSRSRTMIEERTDPRQFDPNHHS